MAGPARTFPNLSKTERWQGQSQVLSLSFQFVWQPAWVQIFSKTIKLPLSLYIATGLLLIFPATPWFVGISESFMGILYTNLLARGETLKV